MARSDITERERECPHEKIADVTRHHTTLLEAIVRNKKLTPLEKVRKLLHASNNFSQCFDTLVKTHGLKDGN